VFVSQFIKDDRAAFSPSPRISPSIAMRPIIKHGILAEWTQKIQEHNTQRDEFATMVDHRTGEGKVRALAKRWNLKPSQGIRDHCRPHASAEHRTIVGEWST
jgi:hypothetical protein